MRQRPAPGLCACLIAGSDPRGESRRGTGRDIECSPTGATKDRTMPQPAETRAAKGPPVLKDAAFNWEDPLDFEGELGEDERMVRDSARSFAQGKLMPRVIAAYR